ncbi:unnamed protein product, partial [Rhizoctonia solani]
PSEDNSSTTRMLTTMSETRLTSNFQTGTPVLPPRSPTVAATIVMAKSPLLNLDALPKCLQNSTLILTAFRQANPPRKRILPPEPIH